MKILIVGKMTKTGSGDIDKVKFDTESKTFNTGKYDVSGGDLLIQALSNREVKEAIETLEARGFKRDTDFS